MTSIKTGFRSDKDIIFKNVVGSDSENPLSIISASEISDLCEISDLLLFFSYFASQNKEIKSGNYFSEVCCVN